MLGPFITESLMGGGEPGAPSVMFPRDSIEADGN